MATKEPESWITVNGRHIPIGAGETKEEAINKALKKDADTKEKQIKQNEEEAKRLNADKEQPQQKQYKDASDWDTFLHQNLKELKKVYDEAEKQGKDGMDAAKNEFYNFRAQQELKDVKEISIEDAIQTLRDNVKDSYISGWFRNGDSGYKPNLVASILGNKGVLNAGMNIAYYNYKSKLKEEGGGQPMDFKTWLHTPQELWRGTRGQKPVDKDIFLSYSLSKKVAAGFTLSDSGGATHRVKDDFSNIDMSKMTSIKIKPIDTWGSYQTTGEQEYLIPVSKLK